MFQILVKIAMFARLVLDSEATKLSNIWPRGSSIPIFLWGGSFFVTKNLSVSTVYAVDEDTKEIKGLE